MRLVGAALVLALSLSAGVAGAAEDTWDGGYSIKATRRSGFAASLQLGYGAARLVGYPNESSKIDNSAFKSTTGTALSSTYTLWLGGALRDWFVFGLGLSGIGASKGKIKGGGAAFIAHVETFPLWSLGGKLRDLSAYGNFGAGGLTLEGGREDADGGFMSVVGGGVSYELFRTGYFAFGPFVEGTYMFSRSAEAGGMYAGIRSTFYGGP